MHNTQPKLVVFCCNWATHGEVDQEVVSGGMKDSTLQIIPTMCSSRVEASHVLNAFSKGADGVLIAACPPGDCHFVSGNTKTDRRVRLLKKVIEQFGIEPNRLRLERLTDQSLAGLQQAITSFASEISELAPFSPLEEVVTTA